MSIPESAIAAAAEALYATGVPRTGNLTTKARAALQAAMPAIREAIAQEVLAETVNHSTACTEGRCVRCSVLKDAARIVRGGTP